MLAARGRTSGPRRIASLAAFAGELIADKTPSVPARTEPASLAGRTISGAYNGRVVAGWTGLLAGGLTAAAGTQATFHIRRLLVRRTGLPDPVVAVGEDVLAVIVAAIATRRPDAAEEATSASDD
jgi:uncharacterized membrane protein